MKTILIISAVLALTFSPRISFAEAAGPGISGGGDVCENKIKSIGLDIQSWILGGGAAGLQLHKKVTLDQYIRSMLAEILSTKVRCVSKGDKGYPVEIEGTAKTCRFDKTPGTSAITCDTDKFLTASIEDQYVLVHHEYAGLAGIEIPSGDDSDYQISNQISAYLQQTVVTKLAVKPLKNSDMFCSAEIERFITRKFPFEKNADGKFPLTHILINKSEYSEATGSVDIEAHAVFSVDGYFARRIFLGAEGVYDAALKPIGCKNLVVKASYFDPLSE